MSTDRTMCTTLSTALDALSPVQRRVLARLAEEDQSRPEWFAAVLHGLVLQSGVDEIRRGQQTEAVLAPLEADHQREVEEIAARAFGPLPQRTEGAEWWPEA